VEHLADLGHRQISRIDGGPGEEGTYIEAMNAAGLGIHMEVISEEFTEAVVRAATEALVTRGQLPVAAFPTNDHSAAEDAAAH